MAFDPMRSSSSPVRGNIGSSQEGFEKDSLGVDLQKVCTAMTCNLNEAGQRGRMIAVDYVVFVVQVLLIYHLLSTVVWWCKIIHIYVFIREKQAIHLWRDAGNPHGKVQSSSQSLTKQMYLVISIVPTIFHEDYCPVVVAKGLGKQTIYPEAEAV